MSSAVTDRPFASTDQVASFHDSLAAMCRAGVPLPRAFAMLASDIRKGPLRAAVRGLAADLADGVPFTDAYARHAESFPPAYAALVSAGAAAGDLPGALAEIARHAERRARVAGTLRRALLAPMVTATFVLVVGTALLVFVGPRVRSIVALTGGDTDVREVVAAGTVALLAGVVLAAALFAWKRSPLDGRAGLPALRLRWPILGPIRLYAGLAGALTTLAALVRRSVPLPEALDLVAATCDEPGLRTDLLAMASAAHDGAGLEAAARGAGALAPSELWLLRAAEERGAPDEGLDDLAAHYAARLDRTVARTARIIAPAAELAIGAVVFVLAYTFVIPVTEMSIRILGSI